MHRARSLLASAGLVLASLAPGQALSQAVTLDGVLTAVWVDSTEPNTNAPAPIWFLTDDSGTTVELRLPPSVLEGAGGFAAVDRRRVTATGSRIAAAGDPSAEFPVAVSALTVLGLPSGIAASQSAAPLNRPYVVVLCRFSDIETEPQEPAFVEQLMNGGFPNMRDYYLHASAQQLDMGGSQVFGWFALPNPRSHYVGGNATTMLNGLTTDCAAAADASVDFSQFSGIVMQFNGNFDGYAYGGSRFMSLDGPSRLWPMVWMPLAGLGVSRYGVYAHEIGHSLGLPHTSGPYGLTYDSDWDVMSNPYLRYDAGAGGWVPGYTIALHKAVLGWIPSGRVSVVSTAQGSMVVEQSATPSSSGNPLMGAVTIPGTSGYYTMEARRLIGYDEGLPGEAIVIHKYEGGSALVMDPDGNGDPNDAGAMWLTGETFDDGKGIRVTVEAQTSEGWSIQVRRGYALTIAGSGTASGTVATAGGAPAPIACSITNGHPAGTCAEAYYNVASIELVATPAPGASFAGWSGACTGTGSCIVSMTEDRSLVASFATAGVPRHSLTITGAGAGSGSVTSDVGGIACEVVIGSTAGSCAAEIELGETVTLTATPGDGMSFTGWTGCTGGGAGLSCVVEMSGDRAVTAAFAMVPSFSITTGSSPAHGGATSGGGSYLEGATVSLVATPADGWEFTKWVESGSQVSASATFDFQVNDSRALTAVFSLTRPASLTTDRISAALLGAITLNPAERDYLDNIGNNNGRFDTGDFLAWLSLQ